MVEDAVFTGAGGAGGVLAELSDAEHGDLVLAIERLHRWTAYTRGRVMLALADRWARRIPTDHPDPTTTIDPDTGRIPAGATHPIRTVPALREHLASAIARSTPPAP